MPTSIERNPFTAKNQIPIS